MSRRTNLAYIGTAVSDALAREMETPTIPTKDRERAENIRDLTVVSGFVVGDHSAEAASKVIDGALRERRKKVETFHTDRDQVADKLAKLGVEPLAILPKVVWERICARTELYRLSPTSDGKIAVNCKGLMERFEWRAMWLNLLLWAGVLVAVMTVAYLVPSETPSAVVAAIIAGLVFGVGVQGLIMGIAFDGAPYVWSHDLITRLQMWAYGFMPHRALLKQYFPGGVSPTDSRSAFEATLVLPVPPKDVAEKLLKARGLALKVAAVAKAIGFMETPSQIMASEHARQVEFRKTKWVNRLHPDPFIYYEHGSAVAVIAQFGDFPIEKQVVDELVNSEHLL